MIKASSGDEDKGWLAGPWNTSLPCPIGFANVGVDDLHFHEEMYEVYLVSRGTSVAVVDGERVDLTAGDSEHSDQFGSIAKRIEALKKRAKCSS